jgi:hypothetical protein
MKNAPHKLSKHNYQRERSDYLVFCSTPRLEPTNSAHVALKVRIIHHWDEVHVRRVSHLGSRSIDRPAGSSFQRFKESITSAL